MDDDFKEWLELEPKEKLVLSYDFSSCRYGNMTTNLSEIYNNILKNVYGLPIMTIVQKIFFKANKFFVERRVNVKEFLARDEMWSPTVLTELTATIGASRSRFANLFDMKKDYFRLRHHR